MRGGADRTGDPILTNEVFHAMHIILSVKLGDHEGLALFLHGRLLKRTLLVVLPAILIQIPIRASLSPVPVCCRGQSGTAWCCLAAAGGTPGPGTQLRKTPYRFCIFYIISLIINITGIISVISKTFYIKFGSLSSSFSLPQVGGWGLIESVCHSVYCCPALNCDNWQRYLPCPRKKIRANEVLQLPFIFGAPSEDDAFLFTVVASALFCLCWRY